MKDMLLSAASAASAAAIDIVEACREDDPGPSLMLSEAPTNLADALHSVLLGLEEHGALDSAQSQLLRAVKTYLEPAA